jgi:hypothetical protein
MSRERAVDSHLPAGCEPGPQSRRMQSGERTSRVLPALTVLFIACFIGIPLAVVSVTGSQPVIYASLGALAVVFPIAMYLLARRFRSRAAWHFQVIAEPLELRRGEEVEAELAVYDLDELDDRVEVGLVCVERYDHPRPRVEDGETVVERATAEAVAYQSWRPAWRTEEPQSFRFRIPPDAPYSYEGDCLSFAWRVVAREPDRGPMEHGASDDPIWVLP